MPHLSLLQNVFSSCARPRIIRYGMAVLLGGFANLLEFQFDPNWTLKLPFVTMYPAIIMISAWFGGLGPGLVCTGFCAVAVWLFWTAPFRSPMSENAGEQLAVAVFVAIGGVISALCEALHRARRREECARMRGEELLAFVSHDLRNPLNAINVTAMLIEKGAAPGEGGDKLRKRPPGLCGHRGWQALRQPDGRDA